MVNTIEAFIPTVKKLYKEGRTDYYLPPVLLANTKGEALGRIQDGDGVIFCCRRGDREYQLTKSIVDSQFREFEANHFNNITVVTFTQYHQDLEKPLVLFNRTRLEDTFGEVISDQGFRQVRIAESEKYSHVTYFFNGHKNGPFPGEDDISIPSPKGIKPYEKPELSLPQVANEAINILREGKYHFLLVNFANGDVIGHFPIRSAQIACAEGMDRQLGKTVNGSRENGYLTVITADHGVFEVMGTEDDPHVSHTCNWVPFILIPPEENTANLAKVDLRNGGSLADVAPTLLELMGQPKPEPMNRKSLIKNYGFDNSYRKLMLIILDGWGLGPRDSTNPIYSAFTPNFDRFLSVYPHTSLRASGQAVGLLPESAGNSEAGHTNMAAGKVVLQDEVKIANSIQKGSIFKKQKLIKAFEETANRGGNLHLIGLLSESSSHGNLDYILAVLRAARDWSFKSNNVYIHLISDGRSTPPETIPRYLRRFAQKRENLNQYGTVVTLVGRGLALDRDRDWQDKTKVVYDALVKGKGIKVEVGG